MQPPISLVFIVRHVVLVMPIGLKGRHVLVIEDAPEVLDVLAKLFRLEGATVVAASNGHDALTAFRALHFDMVVTDLGLPDIPGDVLIRAIIAAARRAIKVVVITGESEPSLTRALEAGAGVVFVKPCEWKSVVTYLNGLSLVPPPEAASACLSRPVRQSYSDRRPSGMGPRSNGQPAPAV